MKATEVIFMTNDIRMPLTAPPAAAAPARAPVSATNGDTQPVSAATAGNVLPPDPRQAAAKEAELAKVVKQLNDYAQAVQREVQFSIDKDSGQLLIKVIDSRTKELIRQMPTEEALAIDRYLDRGYGLMLHAKA